MQIKKDEVRLAILKQAEKEFYEKGFLNASVRQIVKSAGTTIGNFYNYFENKEALFEELVKGEYINFMYFIENHDKVEKPDYLWDITDAAEWRKVLGELLQSIMPAFSDRFVLLVECSEGTRFENMRSIITDMMKEHFIEHMQRFSPDYACKELAEVIAGQLLTGVIAILRRHKDEGIRKKLLTEYMLFYFIGTMGLLGYKP